MFRQAFVQALGRAPNVDWRPLTDAQCAGISFTRLVLGDPRQPCASRSSARNSGLATTSQAG
jgi:hypothetical protein